MKKSKIPIKRFRFWSDDHPFGKVSFSFGYNGPIFPACLICLVTLLFAVGCGVGQFQTARPTPRKHMDFSFGTGFVYNENVSERFPAGHVPLIFNARFGLTDRMDLGVRQFFLLGVASDVKVNLMAPTHPFALSLSGGLGFAFDILRGPVLNLPITLHASYDFSVGITPYAGVGYSSFWILMAGSGDVNGDSGRDLAEGESYAKQKGYGSGVLTVNAGVSFDLSSMVALLLEYNYWHQLVNDPGDFFTFVDNHIILVGLRFRWAIGGS